MGVRGSDGGGGVGGGGVGEGWGRGVGFSGVVALIYFRQDP